MRRARSPACARCAATGDEDGAQRVAWTDTWITARDWLGGRARGDRRRHRRPRRGRQHVGDAARRLRALRDRRRPPRLGPERRLARRRAQRRRRARGAARARRPSRAPLTIKLVDWADEEGARFGRSLLGSSACAGTLDPDAVRGLTDRDGTALPDALAAHGVELDRMSESGARLDGALAYLELHIEQGPVLEQLDLPLGAVLGTFGVAAPPRPLHRRARARRARARCTCAATRSSPRRAARSPGATTPRRATTCAPRPAS